MEDKAILGFTWLIGSHERGLRRAKPVPRCSNAGVPPAPGLVSELCSSVQTERGSDVGLSWDLHLERGRALLCLWALHTTALHGSSQMAVCAAVSMLGWRLHCVSRL